MTSTSPFSASNVTPQIAFIACADLEQGSSAQAAASRTSTVLETRRRSPPPNHEDTPTLVLSQSSEVEHTFSVRLAGFSPEMVTVSARRENRLAVVADLWHSEDNCHLEWVVTFVAEDANPALTRAQFSSNDVLTLHVPRQPAQYSTQYGSV